MKLTTYTFAVTAILCFLTYSSSAQAADANCASAFFYCDEPYLNLDLQIADGVTAIKCIAPISIARMLDKVSLPPERSLQYRRAGLCGTVYDYHPIWEYYSERLELDEARLTLVPVPCGSYVKGELCDDKKL
jgi:hypothetical protein